MIELLAIGYFALATFDAWLTRKRINQYGPQVEGNSVIRDLATNNGSDIAVALGVLLPSVLITLLLAGYNMQVTLSILIGYRLRMFVNQYQSIQFEKEVRRIKDSLKVSGE
jgi:hypothetical protein